MSQKISILVVEDIPVLREIKERELKELGFQCISIGSELDAMRVIENGFCPESALIDFQIPAGGLLPDLDNESFGMTGGLRLAKYILDKTEGRCRITIMSGVDSYRQYAQEAGVWGFVSKPCNNDEALYEMLKKGFLKDEEMRQPTLDINYEINKLSWGKER